MALAGLARMAYRVQPPEAVLHSIYTRFLPFAGFMNWTGIMISGPNDLGLAMVCATLGRHDEADGYFASTLAPCEQAQARVWIARIHNDWSRILADRGDKVRAREHAEIALAMASELGMNGPFGVVARAQAVLDSL